MAEVILTGFDELQDAFKAISSIPFSVTRQALDGMADVAEGKIRATGESMGVRDTDPDAQEHILDNISRQPQAREHCHAQRCHRLYQRIRRPAPWNQRPAVYLHRDGQKRKRDLGPGGGDYRRLDRKNIRHQIRRKQNASV